MTIPFKRIAVPLATLVFAGAVVAGATGAFFSDTETSTGNTFSAGSLDLKVDSESHYNGSICTLGDHDDVSETAQTYQWVGGNEYPVGLPCDGTWSETDLGAEHKFFDLSDIKPGDEGENTISLHVYDNDAWGRFVISNVEDLDNTCTEPENEAINPIGPVDLDPECNDVSPTPGEGELADSISFGAWIDDGATPGFQGLEDEGEGDNVKQEREVMVITPGSVDEEGETHNIWEGLTLYRASLGSACDATDIDGNGQTDNDGIPSEDDYLACQGIATDGRLVGSTTYYFALAWNVPESVGNEAQTDSLDADLSFEVSQHRSNPSHSF